MQNRLRKPCLAQRVKEPEFQSFSHNSRGSGSALRNVGAVSVQGLTWDMDGTQAFPGNSGRKDRGGRGSGVPQKCISVHSLLELAVLQALQVIGCLGLGINLENTGGKEKLLLSASLS